MDIGDVGNFSFGERQRHFFQQMSGKNSPITTDDMAIWDGPAWRQAAEEMLMEQHAMLRALCVHAGLIA